MTTMILAVMSCASLGHTGRELKPYRITVAYVCVTAGALVRVAASVRPGGVMLNVVAVIWGAALLLFVIVDRPILWGRAVGDTV